MKTTVKHITFIADSETIQLIEALKKELRIPTTAALFRRSLGIMKLAHDEARSSDGFVTIRGRKSADDKGVTIALNV